MKKIFNKFYTCKHCPYATTHKARLFAHMAKKHRGKKI